ncbi:MAG: glycosyltransferase family 4 protein [Sporichthyaceae bacterium]
MKVLIAHNRYRSEQPSGENQVVDAEIELLGKAGVEVVTQVESSDSLKDANKRQMLEAGIGPLYAPSGVARFRRLLETEQPDVVHLHNTIPLISPWVIRVAHAAGVPVVQTVHNYRHSCVSGLHFRNGRSCSDCLGKRLPSPALIHGCYRDSKAQTLPVATAQVFHRGTWHLAQRFIALTPFMAETLIRAGLPAEKITVRPSWVADRGFFGRPGRGLLYVGRLDEAKGIRLLLDAWRLVGVRTGRRLQVAGDGPMRAEVEAAASETPELIGYAGRVDAPEVVRLMHDAGALVVPSLCFEGYPLVIAEAFGSARAVVTVSGGSAGTIVDSAVGWVAQPTPDDLGATLASITDDALVERGRNARIRYEVENSPRAGTESLLEIYRAVIASHGALAAAS